MTPEEDARDGARYRWLYGYVTGDCTGPHYIAGAHDWQIVADFLRCSPNAPTKAELDAAIDRALER